LVTTAFRVETAFLLGGAALLGAVPIIARGTARLGSTRRTN